MVILWLCGCTWLNEADLKRALDPDGDGSPWPEDCDQDRADVHPGAVEACNGLDDDCDGETDPADAEGCLVAYEDLDGDGVAGTERCLCDVAGLVASAEDCDDTRAEVHPGAEEVCNGLDDNCDGTTDPEGSTGCQEGYVDEDGDGHAGSYACSCEGTTAAEPSDCDDGDPDVHPGAEELCGDGEDQSCASSSCPEEGLACVERGPLSLSEATSEARGTAETLALGATVASLEPLLPGALAIGEWGGDQLWILDEPPSASAELDELARVELRAPELHHWLGQAVLALPPEGAGSGALLISAPGNYTDPGAAWLLPFVDLEAPNALSNQGRELWSGETGLMGSSLASGDLDGDGLTEVLIGEVGPNRVLVFGLAELEAAAAGEQVDLGLAEQITCSACPSYAAFGWAMAIGDYSGSGGAELLVLSHNLALVLSPGVESLDAAEAARLAIQGPVVSTSVLPDGNLLPPADLDGDGALDLAFTVYGPEPVALLSGASLRYDGTINLAEDADAMVGGVTHVTSLSSADVDGDCLPELLVGHATAEGEQWVPMLDALRLDFSEPHPSVDEAVLRIEGEPLNAQRRLIGRPQAAPEGGLPWLAVGAEGTGGDHGLDPAGAVHFFDLHKP